MSMQSTLYGIVDDSQSDQVSPLITELHHGEVLRIRAAKFASNFLPRTPRGWVGVLIFTTFVARVLFASWMGLGIDESYMVAAGRTLRTGYFDHPPMAWWLSWAAQRITGSDLDLIVRLPFILLFSLTTWSMFQLGRELHGERAGLWAAAAMNTAPVLGVTSACWVLPDGPLIAALLGATVCFVHALPLDRPRWGWWLGTGLCLGVAANSKYTAIPIALGFALFLLTEPVARRWLRQPQPYVAAFLSCCVFAPVIVWNARHSWISLAFQAARSDGGHWHLFGPITTLAGESLFFLPWIWLPLAMSVVGATRRGPADRSAWMLVCLCLPTVLLFEMISLRGHVLFHWTAPATLLALPLLGRSIGHVRSGSWLLRPAATATALLVTTGALAAASEVRFNWMPDFIEDFPLGADPDIDGVDWTSLHDELDRRGELHSDAVVAATRWFVAGKVDYALGGSAAVICLGDDPREYGLSSPASAHDGEDVLIVAPRETLESIKLKFRSEFQWIEQLSPIMLVHRHRPAMVLPLFRGHHLHIGKHPSDRWVRT